MRRRAAVSVLEGRWHDRIICSRTGRILEERAGRNRIVVGGLSHVLRVYAGIDKGLYEVTHWAFGAGDAGWGGGAPPPSATVPPDLKRLVDERLRRTISPVPPAPTDVVRAFVREIPPEAGAVSDAGSTATTIHDAARFEPTGWFDGQVINYDPGTGFVADTIVSYVGPDPGAGLPGIFTVATGDAGLAGGGDPYNVERKVTLDGSIADAGTTTTIIVDAERTQPSGFFDGDWLEVEGPPGEFTGRVVSSYLNPGPSGSPEFTLASAVPGLTEFSVYRLPAFDVSNQLEFRTTIGPGPSVGFDLREHGLIIRGTDAVDTGILFNSIRHSPIFFDISVLIERRIVITLPFTG